MGDEDSVKGGSLIYMPYSHSFLTRGKGHRVLISDVQLLQWYSRRRDIRRNPLPYAIVHDAVMDLLANQETLVTRDDTSHILITPATTTNGTIAVPLAPAVIQHAIPLITNHLPSSPWPRTAATLRLDARKHTRHSSTNRTISERSPPGYAQ